jgi:hypothetical protein
MKKFLIIGSLTLLCTTLMSLFVNKNDDKLKLTEEKCLKVQYNCDGKVFTEIIKGETYEDNKKKAQSKYPNCKMTIINQSCK